MSTSPSTIETDEQLASAASRRKPGDRSAEKAFLELYERHARALLAWLASRASPSDLDDLQQEIWQRVWSKLPDHFHGGNFRAWLFQIARNYLVDTVRRRRPEGSIDDPDAGPTADPNAAEPWQELVDEERRAQLAECLEKLDKPKLRVVQGRLSGDSYETIAAASGMTCDQAYKAFFNAKKQLELCLQRDVA